MVLGAAMETNYLSELRKLNKIYKRKNKVEKELSESFDDFLSAGGMQKPRELCPTAKAPSPASFISKLIPAVIIFFLTILFLVLTISSFRGFLSSKTIQANPGEAYNAWLESWGSISVFEDLEPGWREVEKDWASRGIDIDWSFVLEVKNRFYSYSTTIYSEDFSNTLLYEVFNHYNTPYTIAFYIIITFVGLILSIAFITKSVKSIKKYLSEKNAYISDRNECETFNRDALPKLLSEYNQTVEKLSQIYAERKSSLEKEIKSCKGEIEPYYDFLSEKYYPYLDSLIDILECGRADDLKEALRVLNSDIAEARERAEEREWRAMEQMREAIHYQTMESYAKQQADAASRQAAAAEEALRLEKKARSDEAAKSRHAESRARSRCYNCAHYLRCHQHGTVNCAAFLPRS